MIVDDVVKREQIKATRKQARRLRERARRHGLQGNRALCVKLGYRAAELDADVAEMIRQVAKNAPRD